jgi:hypothetical protein
MWQVTSSLAATIATLTMGFLALTYSKKEDWTAWFSIFFVLMSILFNVVNAYIPIAIGQISGVNQFYFGAIVSLVIATNAFSLYVLYKVFTWMVETAKNAKRQD